MDNSKRFSWPVHPVAQAENCVSGKCYRFTVLTDRLIRMEYDPAGIFEDRASQAAFVWRSAEMRGSMTMLTGWIAAQVLSMPQKLLCLNAR